MNLPKLQQSAKNPINKNFKNGSGTHTFPIKKHYKEQVLYTEKLIIIK